MLCGGSSFDIFLHPLRSYPGPLLWQISNLPREFHAFRGTAYRAIHKIHQEYGPTVRIGPNQLSFTESQAFRDIYGHVPGREEIPKDHRSTALPPNGLPSILRSEKSDHTRYRRLLSHAFSDRGLKDQELHIRLHVNLLVERLDEQTTTGHVTDIMTWISMAAFDMIGDLGFGESFNSLGDRQLHDWVEAVQGNVKCNYQQGVTKRNGIAFLNRFLMGNQTLGLREKNYTYVKEKLDKRIRSGTDRGDFWDRIVVKSANDNESGDGMSEGEMLNNASVLILGGSETSVSALTGMATRCPYPFLQADALTSNGELRSAGTLYLLLKHPQVLRKLNQEIRSVFKSNEEITLFSVCKLSYAIAVLDESMRIYPPISSLAVRLVPKGGAMICGHYVPENVSSLTFESHFFFSIVDGTTQDKCGRAPICVEPFRA